jgi:hypothetical protein
MLKDEAISFAATLVLKKKIERYGTMMDFKIDSSAKKVYLKVNLKGEASPLEVIIERYSLVKKEDGNYIVIDGVSISKEWMNLLAADLIKKKEVKLPDGIASTIAKLVL